MIGANDAPLVAGAVSAAGSEGSGGFTVNLLAGASDIDHGAVLHVANLAWTDTGSGLPAGFTAAGNALTVDTSNAAYNAMAQGETFTTHFAYDVVDEHGASVRQTATVAITGANDAPVITGGDTTGSVQENTVNQTTGQLDAFDPDHGAVLSWAVQGGSASGSADYRFSADSFTVIRSGLLPTVTIAPPPGPVTEGGALAFTLTRTGDLSQALTVNLNTTFAGANNFDISAPSTAVFTPGTATTVVNVQALDDTFVEANQGFVLNIVPGPGYVSGVAFNASGTILDNDVAAPPTIPPAPVPTITIAATDGVGTEAIDGPDFTYTFTRTGDLSQALSVNYQIIGNPPNITNPADIVTPATPFVMFAPGSATATLSFDAVDDALVEGTETFSIGIAPGVEPSARPRLRKCGNLVDDFDFIILYRRRSSFKQTRDRRPVGSLQSSVHRRHIEQFVPNPADVEPVSVPCTSIASIIYKHFQARPIDLLSIDAEGYESVILRSVDFAKFLIKAIFFESLHLGSAEESLMEHLASHGFVIRKLQDDAIGIRDSDLLAAMLPGIDRILASKPSNSSRPTAIGGACTLLSHVRIESNTTARSAPCLS